MSIFEGVKNLMVFQNTTEPNIIPDAIEVSNWASTMKSPWSTSLTKTGRPMIAGPIIKILFIIVRIRSIESPFCVLR